MRVAVVLHAHLPWVRHARAGSVEERWFHDARWSCYPRLARLAERFPLTISVSPPLLAMLADPILASRFEAHRAALRDLGRRHGGAACEAFDALLEAAGVDVLRCLRGGRSELWTSAATHAYLPGWGARPHHVGAQLRVGAALFAAGMGRAPAGRWLPECAIDPLVEAHLEGAGATVVAAHAVPPGGAVRGPSGVTLLPRDREATLRVWSRRDGYPGAGAYREFHRDLGHEEEVAPFDRGTMTGLKPWAIDGAPYRPSRARAQAEAHADDLVRHLARLAREGRDVVLAFDAELFGHWWFEGPWFLGALLERLEAHRTLAPVPASALEARGAAQPISSSWGEGGDHRVWIGPATASWWRHLHRTAHALEALAGAAPAPTARAIVELLQLQASDWPFLVHARSAGDYPLRRLAFHHARAWRWAGIASGQVTPTDEEQHELAAPRDGPCAALDDEALVAAFFG